MKASKIHNTPLDYHPDFINEGTEAQESRKLTKIKEGLFNPSLKNTPMSRPFF